MNATKPVHKAQLSMEFLLVFALYLALICSLAMALANIGYSEKHYAAAIAAQSCSLSGAYAASQSALAASFPLHIFGNTTVRSGFVSCTFGNATAAQYIAQLPEQIRAGFYAYNPE